MNKTLKHFRDFFDLFYIQLMVYRVYKSFILIMAVILPVGIIVMMKFLIDINQPSQAIYIISGNIVISMVGVSTVMLAQVLSHMKEVGSFEYYASLPISKLNLIMAIIAVYFLLSLPGIITVFIVGNILFKLNIFPHPLLLVFMPLTIFSLSGLGALIGIYSRRELQANMISQMVNLGIIFLSPVIIPLEKLPNFLASISKILPSTYAAHGIREMMCGNWNTEIIKDIIVLIIFSIISFFVIAKKIQWYKE